MSTEYACVPPRLILNTNRVAEKAKKELKREISSKTPLVVLLLLPSFALCFFSFWSEIGACVVNRT